MAIVSGTFATRLEADDAIQQLKAAGFTEDEFALISREHEAVGAPKDDEQRGHETVEAATVGAAVGAVVGGALLGPLGAVLGGAAAGGGLAALLRTRGMEEAEARAYEERLRAGRLVLLVYVDEADRRAAEARRILQGAGADRVELEP
jgi:uncharacterized membrane protein